MNLFDLCCALFRAIGQGIVWLRRRCGDMLRLTYRKWWIVLPLMILGIVLGVYHARPSKQIYKVNAVATLNGVSREVVRTEFTALGNLDKNSEQQNLAAVLNITPEQAEAITQFKAFDVIDCMKDGIPDYVDYGDRATRKDTMYTHMEYLLALQFQTSDMACVPVVEDAIVRHLNSRPYLQQEYAYYRANLERESRFHHDQVEKLDSMTTLFYYTQDPQQLQWSNQTLVLGRREIKTNLPEIYREFEMKKKTDRKLAVCTAPVVLQSHFLAEAAAVNSLPKCVAIAMIFGWILGLVIAAIVEKRQQIVGWLRQ